MAYQSKHLRSVSAVSDDSIQVLGSRKLNDQSFENPYETAKKRQSTIVAQPANGSGFRGFSMSDVQKFEIDSSRKKADLNLKLVVVGDGGCGKTCLLISYSQGKFPTIYVPTIFENYISQVRGPQNQIVELALWDTAGQEEYDRLRPLSYPDTSILLVCYAIDNRTTLENITETWAPEVRHFCAGVPIVLVGTKLDLLSTTPPDNQHDFVPESEADEIARTIGASAHVRCSAKTRENVEQVFNTAISIVLKSRQAANVQDSKNNRFSKQFKRQSRIPNTNDANNTLAAPASNNVPDPIYVSDYYKNAEYEVNPEDFDYNQRKKKRRCIIF